LAKFKRIYIEITNCCNLTCSFCSPSRRTRSFITPEAFAEVLEKCTGFTEHIYLHVLGEPLLHPDIGLLFDISEAYGFRVNLTTNGTLLAQTGKLLLSKAALRQVNVSLHSIEQTRSSENFHLYLDGVLAFIRLAGNPPPVFINLRLWNLHRDTFDLNERILERLASFFKLPSLITGNDARSLPLAPGVFLSWDRRFEWPHASAPDLGGYGRCRGLHDHIAILVDGTVVPCCLDAEADIPLGNILQGNLNEILTGTRAVSMREGFARQRIVEPLCRRCEYKKRFAAGLDRKEM
jgi:radical SAM protein with 4Fe4S-binding SPASM domain